MPLLSQWIKKNEAMLRSFLVPLAGICRSFAERTCSSFASQNYRLGPRAFCSIAKGDRYKSISIPKQKRHPLDALLFWCRWPDLPLLREGPRRGKTPFRCFAWTRRSNPYQYQKQKDTLWVSLAFGAAGRICRLCEGGLGREKYHSGIFLGPSVQIRFQYQNKKGILWMPFCFGAAGRI